MKLKIKIGGMINKMGNLKSELKALRSCGYDYAEFGYNSPEKFIKEYTKNYKEFSKIVPLLSAHMPAITSDKEELKENKKFISDHLKIGCKNFIFHFYTSKDGGPLSKEVFEKRIKNFRELAVFARKHEANFILENTIRANAKDLKMVFDKIREIYFCLDIGHANLFTKKNISLDLIKIFSKKLRHIHAHDNRGGYDTSWDLHLSIGAGKIDFKPIFKKLRKIKYSGTITLEVHNFDDKYRKISLNKIKELIGA